MRIGFAALERDAHAHLSHGAAREGVGATERLRTEDGMHAEGAALSHESIEQHRCALRNTIIVKEELLEFVDDEQDARHANIAPRSAETRDVLHASVSEEFAATREFGVQTLEHREAELAIRFNRDRACVRKRMFSVRLEFDALLEVDKPEFNLVG